METHQPLSCETNRPACGRLRRVLRKVWAVWLLPMLALLCLACSRDPDNLAGAKGGSETTNGIFATALRPDGTPAAGAQVHLRRTDYFAKPLTVANASTTSADTRTDSLGRFQLTDIDSGAYTLEINDGQSLATLKSFVNTPNRHLDLGALPLSPFAVVMGQVDTVGRGSKRLFAQIQGCEHSVELNAAGAYIFDNLPEANLNLRIRALDTTPWSPSGPGWTTKVIHGIPSVAGDTARIAAILPSPWQNKTIGETPMGSATFIDSQFVITGGGPDFWHTTDGFQFLYQLKTGDVAIVARVQSIQRSHDYAKASVMIRADLSATADHAAMNRAAMGTVFFQWRDSLVDSAKGNSNIVHPSPDPQWIKLERKGDTLTGSYSQDGITWILNHSEFMRLPASVYVGLAVSSHRTDTLCTAIFDNLILTP